ncbi:MAG: DUF3124 domain-containing protein [Planctomycetaceae bacterium]
MDAFIRQLKLLIAGLVAVVLLPLLIYTWYLDRRLDSFELTLQHRPPDSLESDESSRVDLAYEPVAPSQGQVVYVPAYSHVYHGDGQPYLLTITLSIRNTSLDRPITVRSVKYQATDGRLLKSYLDQPVKLPPLGTTEVVISREDSAGGSGANFIVEWFAREAVTAPIIEAVMIDTSGEQGISFARRGEVVREARLATVAPTESTPSNNGSAAN